MDDKSVSLEQLKLNYASLGKKTRLGQEMFMLNDRNRNYQYHRNNTGIENAKNSCKKYFFYLFHTLLGYFMLVNRPDFTERAGRKVISNFIISAQICTDVY